MLTVTQFKKIFPNCKNPNEWVSLMTEMFPSYYVNTDNRIAAFLAQCGHESMGFTVFSENLNYSSKALNVIFPKYFANAGINADDYHRKPEAIANVIYANRMGNTEPGDGWKYRGRGIIQLTGKNNYQAFKDSTGIDVVNNPELITNDNHNALETALWFWNKQNLNILADNAYIKKMTKKINGGYNGLEEREELFYNILNYLKPSIQQGSRGKQVKEIQRMLGLNGDGFFGRTTALFVKKWQNYNDLIPDGIIGPKTYEKMSKLFGNK